MFGSVKSNGSGMSQSQAVDNKFEEQVDNKPRISEKEDVNFSMFGSVKSNGSGMSQSQTVENKFEEPVNNKFKI